MNPTFTLQTIRDNHPCKDGWEKLLIALGYSNGHADLTRIVSLGDIAKSNGIKDALWCIRCVAWKDIAVRREILRAVIIPAVKRASKHTKDKRVHDCIDALDKWIAGDNNVDLRVHRRSAADAAYAAAAYADAERDQQLKDLLAAFPPVALA